MGGTMISALAPLAVLFGFSGVLAQLARRCCVFCCNIYIAPLLPLAVLPPVAAVGLGFPYLFAWIFLRLGGKSFGTAAATTAASAALAWSLSVDGCRALSDVPWYRIKSIRFQ